MRSKIIELLMKKNILRGKDVNIKRIGNATLSEITNLIEEIAELTKLNRINTSNSSFVFSASRSLSGDNFPCNALECRQDSARRLAQFAALYSDKIYIANYLSKFDALTEQVFHDNEAALRYKLYCDVKILAMLEPLISTDIIIPYSEPSYCPICDKEKGLSPDVRRRYNRKCDILEKECLNKISVNVKYDVDHYCVTISGPQDLIQHGSRIITSSSLSLPYNSASMRKLRAGQEVTLSKSEILKSKIHTGLAYSIVHDIPLQLFTSEAFHASFLSDQEKQINILNSICADTALARQNEIVEKHLTTLVPFLTDIDIIDLIKIRKREEESFVLFRQGLNSAINEYKSSGHNFTEKSARELYSDLIAPNLVKLDLKISSAKKDLIKSTARKTIGWLGAISFGLYSRIIPNDLAMAATSLGLVKVGAEFLETMMSKSDGSALIKNEQMYFLWRVRQAAKKRKVQSLH